MIKKLQAMAIGAALLTGGVATAEAASPKAKAKPAVTRTKNNPGSLISSSATVPPGSTIIYLSGATASPIDLAKPEELGDTRQQTLNILTKMKAQLEGLGLGMGDLVKMTVFLVGTPENGGRMDAPAMNEVFKTFFGTPEQPNAPTRSTVQVAALGRPYVLVEIEGIAAKAP